MIIGGASEKLTFAVMVMLKNMSANGRTLVCMMDMPWFSSSEMIVTSNPLLSLQHIFSRTVSPRTLDSMVGLDPLVTILWQGPDEEAVSSVDMLHLVSKLDTYVLLASCDPRVSTFSWSCFTYLMVLSRRVILSV
jgi:hypothetical protein